MRAIVFTGVGQPLVERDIPRPEPGPGSVRLTVHACGVCRTDLHIVDGQLPRPKLPLVLGHQIVATVNALGEGVTRFPVGQRIGVPWLAWTCGRCRYCRSGRENLCDTALFTGYNVDGGFADETIADERYCFAIPDGYPDVQAAPLLCAGLIGYRAYSLTGDAERLGLYGFGAAAHIVCQIARAEGRRVFAFSRPGDTDGQAFAKELGAEWAGGSDERPPEELDAAIVFAAAGELVPAALAASAKGGSVICAGIHMTEIPSFPYELLWGERSIRSVANLTRRDGETFMRVAPAVPVHTAVTAFPLAEAGTALDTLRSGSVRGAVVVSVAPSDEPSTRVVVGEFPDAAQRDARCAPAPTATGLR